MVDSQTTEVWILCKKWLSAYFIAPKVLVTLSVDMRRTLASSDLTSEGGTA